MPLRRVIAAVAALLAAGSTAATGAPGPSQRDAALDRALAVLVSTRSGPPGAIALVQRGPRLTVHAFGVARVGETRPPRAGDRMKIASVSKAFSGAVALALVHRGALSLDDTIGGRLPELPAAWHAVTLRELLNHTSGLPDYTGSPAARRAVAASLGRSPAPEKLLRFVRDRPLRFPPGSRYRYSNSDNVAVALMVRAVTDQPYERELRRLVLAPLGLVHTSLPRGPGLARPFMHGYTVEPPKRPEDVGTALAGGWAWASGGIVSTPRDLNRFIRADVGGRLFGVRERAEQRRVVVGGTSDPEGPGANAAGLGLFRYRTSCGTVWGHTGNILGYTQFAAASPDGRRSATLSITSQVTPAVLAKFRRAAGLAVCAALGR
jgi:D-alanyl-D-alanine carboxypeptidase